MVAKSANQQPPIEVTVEIEGEELLVGNFRVHDRRGQSMTFQYSESYIGDPRAYPIDPALPLSLGVFQPPIGWDMFGVFSDTAPDRWGQNLMRRSEREAADREERKQRSLGPINFVLGVRDVLRQGAVRFRDAHNGDHIATDGIGVPALIQLPHLLAVADAYVEGHAIEREINDLLRAGGSLGGARPKAAVTLKDGSLAIAKFPNKKDDNWDIALWEAVEAELAKRSGILMATVELERVANRNIVISHRFDRQDSRRIGFMSAMTMLEARDGDARSYVEIAREIEVNSSTVAGDLAELFRRIAFCILTNNTDDHLRNHGFLRINDAWQLSPAYDMNPNPELATRTTALDPDGLNASIESLVEIAELFRLDDAKAKLIVGEVEGGTREWRRVAETKNAKRSEIELMRVAFDNGERDVARALSD
jgi:serine/threonine-protein kinase HipA